jgi:hypothetical protein
MRGPNPASGSAERFTGGATRLVFPSLHCREISYVSACVSPAIPSGWLRSDGAELAEPFATPLDTAALRSELLQIAASTTGDTGKFTKLA